MALDGWLTRLTAFLKGVWESFAEWGNQLFGKVERWWVVVLGILTTVVTATSDALSQMADVFTNILATVYGLFGGFEQMDVSGSFSGSPWPGTLSTINKFIPLKEGFAFTMVLIGTMGVILLWRGTAYAVLLFKRVFFNWM